MAKHEIKSYNDYVKFRVINSDKLEKLESSIGEKIPKNLLYKTISEERAEEFMRKYYCKELQQTVTNLGSQDRKNIEGVDVIEFNGNKFAMLINALGAYNHFDEEFDFTPRKNGSKTLATSLITDEFLGHYSNPNKDLIILGYTNIPNDSLYLCGPQDICSILDNGSYEKRAKYGVNYMPARQMARQTSCYYNEYAMLRINSQGEAILPTCVVSFDTNVSEKNVEFAKKHNLPIVIIDWQKYKAIQQQKLLDFENKDNVSATELETYLYGLVAYTAEILCSDIGQGYSYDYIDILKEKFESVLNKHKIMESEEYKKVFMKFKEFQENTTNDALGPVISREILQKIINNKQGKESNIEELSMQ